MIDLYWSAGARDAHDGRTVFSQPGGGTRVGERLTDLALTLRSDPAAPSPLLALRGRPRVQRILVGVRQRAAARAHLVDL